MKAKAKLYGPMLLAALLCALVFATGAMKKPSEFELLNGQYMQLAGGKTRYAVADGDAYGALPGEMAGLHLPAGEYRLRWMISGDGDNVLRLKNDDGAAITPDEFVLPADEGEGECVFEIEEACENFAVEIEFASGSYLDVYGLKLYTPKYQDDAFTLLFFAIGASVLYGLLATGRLTRRNMAPALFIGLAVLLSCSMSLKSTFNYGHDGAYHLARLQNLADGLKSGQFPVRMGGFSFNGYGAITSVFYPDVFLYPFALMLLGGASAAYVGNVLLAALNIGAAAGMYAAAKRLFQNRWAATCASVLYTLSAYRVMDVYTRVAVGEAMAMAFFPLFIVELYEALFGDAKCWRMLALSACGIFLSHMLSTMLCAVLAAGAALLCLRRVIGQKRFVPLAKAAGLCLLLGLFQLAPFCMYSMQGIGAGTLVNDLTVNAVEPGQILMMGAGSASGSSANQKVLAFSVEIGLPLLIGAMLALYAALQKPERGENEKAVLRLLALAGGYGVTELGGKRPDAAAAAALCMAAVCVMPTLSGELHGARYIEQGATVSPHLGLAYAEYTLPDTNFLETRDRSLHIEGGVAVADYAKRGTTITAQVEAATEGTVSFPLFDYDGYRATLNGQEIAVETGDNNRVQIRVPAGTDGEVRIWFAGKRWWKITDAVSLAALLAVLLRRKFGKQA